MSVSLSCMCAADQFPPSVVLFTRTHTQYANHSEVFIAVFSEPVANLTNSSILLVNAVMSGSPWPVDPSYPIEWEFEIEPLDQGYVSTAIASASFVDLSGNANPIGSELFWFNYDSIQPIVISVIPSIPLTEFVNLVTLNKTIFTAVFDEVSCRQRVRLCVYI